MTHNREMFDGHIPHPFDGVPFTRMAAAHPKFLPALQDRVGVIQVAVNKERAIGSGLGQNRRKSDHAG